VPAALDLLRRDGSGRLEIVSEAPLVVDCGGRHAWSVAPALADLAVELACRDGSAMVEACRVRAPEELAVVVALAARHGLGATVTSEGDRCTIVLEGAPEPAAAELVERLRRDGLEVDTRSWWQLYLDSKQALAPDSVRSRRHAGAIMVTEDGRVVGRCDEEDTDLAILTARSPDEVARPGTET
jgi:hypothetical protein